MGLLDNPERNALYRDNARAVLRSIEALLASTLADPAKIDKASLNNVAYAFQQVVNVRRLEEGKCTENIDVHVEFINQQARLHDKN